MADSLLSSISTFHTTKIIVTDPSKFPFNGSIPASMYACVPDASKLFQAFKSLPSSGPRELTLEMIKSLEEADKPPQRGKKPNLKKKEKEDQVTKVTTSKRQKFEKAAPSQPQKKKVKKLPGNHVVFHPVIQITVPQINNQTLHQAKAEAQVPIWTMRFRPMVIHLHFLLHMRYRFAPIHLQLHLSQSQFP
uniref:Uncharacterized protein n=1 Tax=Lactuca sativa TaxID=4236 RepID=A0A9R1WXF5_LACSA|nr:hypothetical protein LSAT_V11C800450750 [Lactuca sativa]